MPVLFKTTREIEKWDKPGSKFLRWGILVEFSLYGVICVTNGQGVKNGIHYIEYLTRYYHNKIGNGNLCE
jgi:hypothetical protein